MSASPVSGCVPAVSQRIPAVSSWARSALQERRMVMAEQVSAIAVIPETRGISFPLGLLYPASASEAGALLTDGHECGIPEQTKRKPEGNIC